MHSKCNALDSSPNYSSPPCPQRNDLPWNQSLAPKRLETAGVKDPTQSSLRRLTFLELCGPLSQGLYALTSVWYLHCLFSLPGMLFSTSPHGVFPHFRCHLFNSGFPRQIILKSNLLHGPSIRPSLPTIKFILSKISPVSLNWNESKYFFFFWMYTAIAWMTMLSFSNYLENRIIWIRALLLISHTLVCMLDNKNFIWCKKIILSLRPWKVIPMKYNTGIPAAVLCQHNWYSLPKILCRERQVPKADTLHEDRSSLALFACNH